MTSRKSIQVYEGNGIPYRPKPVGYHVFMTHTEKEDCGYILPDLVNTNKGDKGDTKGAQLFATKREAMHQGSSWYKWNYEVIEVYR